MPGSPLPLRVCSLFLCAVCVVCMGTLQGRHKIAVSLPWRSLGGGPVWLSPGLDPGRCAHPPPGQPPVSFRRPFPPTLHRLSSLYGLRVPQGTCSWKLLPKGLCCPCGGMGGRWSHVLVGQKAPPGTWSRKFCSDPQLWVSPGQSGQVTWFLPTCLVGT